jgi:hypothetical protein
MTVCRWNDLLTGLDWKMIEARSGVPDWTLPSTSYFKSTAPKSAEFRVPQFCRVSGGPWFAQITTTESCNDLIPDVSSLEILGAPEHFAIQWPADLRDIPAPFREQDFSLAGSPLCICCGGFMQCPDGRCVPPGTSCEIHPA